MLLAVDVGNSHTVFGLFEEDSLRAHWRIATRREATADELGVTLRALFASGELAPASVGGMIVSSVVPNMNGVLTAVGGSYFGVEPLFVVPGIRTGMPILYENPHEVGADRIVNAVAGKARLGAPVIILDFGTATTLDVVSPDGAYLGGVIAPGLGVAAEALFERAARLHPVDVQRPQRVVGRNTEESIQSGLFYGYASLVEGLVRRVRRDIGADAPVIATGGLAPGIESELPFLEEVDLNLTLHGLRLVWSKNAK